MKSGTDMHIMLRKCNAAQVFLHAAELVSAAFFRKKSNAAGAMRPTPGRILRPKILHRKNLIFSSEYA